ncbi:MAG: AIR synthase-related protein [Lachnospiraceae bacterium]|nr:AIR synthase-related protein [Lachnospiraceae bacterium]
MISLRADDKILERSIQRPLDLKAWQLKIPGVPCMKTAVLQSDALNENGYLIPFYRAVNELSALGIKKMAVSVAVVYPGKFGDNSPSVDFIDEKSEKKLCDNLKKIKKLCDTLSFVFKDAELSITKTGNVKTVTVTAVEIADEISDEIADGIEMADGSSKESDSLSDNRRKDESGKVSVSDYELKRGLSKDLSYDIVMTKSAGMSGAILSASEWILSGKHFPWKDEYVNKLFEYSNHLSVVKECQIAAKHGARIMLPVSDGGVSGALWRLGIAIKCGIDIDGKKICVSQDIIELCEFFDLSPYELMGDGSLIIATENGEELKNKLLCEGIKAEVIGKTSTLADKTMTFFGNKRYITKSRGDEMRIVDIYNV